MCENTINSMNFVYKKNNEKSNALCLTAGGLGL